MNPDNRTFEQEQHVESHAPYMTIFFVLLNFTAQEYVFAKTYGLPSKALALIGTALVFTILTAVAKAFFHVEFNRKWALLTMVPALLLAFLGVPLIPGLLILAVTKATLVGWWFMHLKFEGRWVYYMLIPAGVLATIMIVALWPDMAMQTTVEDQEVQERPLSMAAPADPARSLL